MKLPTETQPHNLDQVICVSAKWSFASFYDGLSFPSVIEFYFSAFWNPLSSWLKTVASTA